MPMPRPDADARAVFDSVLPDDPRVHVRPMKKYVFVPSEWRREPDRVDAWLARSLIWVGEMPEKKAKKKK